MLRRILSRSLRSFKVGHKTSRYVRYYSERRRRSGDGIKKGIFEERSGASQDEYFRKERARQLKELREKLQRAEDKCDKDREEEVDEEPNDR